MLWSLLIEAMHLPAGDTAPPRWGGSLGSVVLCTSFPSASQILARLPAASQTMSCPSRVYAACQSPPDFPAKSRESLPVAGSQILRLPSPPREASFRLSGENAKALQYSV